VVMSPDCAPHQRSQIISSSQRTPLRREGRPLPQDPRQARPLPQDPRRAKDADHYQGDPPPPNLNGKRQLYNAGHADASARGTYLDGTRGAGGGVDARKRALFVQGIRRTRQRG